MSDSIDRRKFLGMAPAFPAAAVTAKLTLTDQDGIESALDVSVLRLKPGDVLVFETDREISNAVAERVTAYAEKYLDLKVRNIKAMVLGEGLKIAGVLRDVGTE